MSTQSGWSSRRPLPEPPVETKPYVVVRTWLTRTGKPRAVAVGVFPNRYEAEKYARDARMEWASIYLAPLRQPYTNDSYGDLF